MQKTMLCGRLCGIYAVTKRPIQAARMVEEQTTTHKWGALMLSKSHANAYNSRAFIQSEEKERAYRVP